MVETISVAETVNFVSDARLLSVLGEQLIGSEKVGILELIKNSYDAGASTCSVHVEGVPGLAPTSRRLTEYAELPGPIIEISDDGAGMSRDDLIAGWLRPASSRRARAKERIRNERVAATQRNSVREYNALVRHLKDAHGGGWKDVYVCHTLDELIGNYNESGRLTMVVQEFIKWDHFVRCICIGQEEILPIKYDPKERKYHVEHNHMSPELGERVVNDARTIVRALGYDMNSIEFAIRDGVPYAIDFMNPAPVMPLVELVKAIGTSDETLNTARELCDALGKKVIVAQDQAGFIVNLILVPYLLDAARLYASGAATKQDIDRGMVLGCGLPMGPLTLADFALAVALPHATRAHIPLAEFPAVQRWHERMNELEAWREPFPEIAVAA